MKSDQNLNRQKLLWAALLAQGRIPPEMLREDDFGDGEHRKLAAWLIGGKSVNAYIDNLNDETVRERALSALNYEPLPEEREQAVKMAESCLSTLRKNRVRRRIDQIKGQMNAASAEQKADLYRQMAELMKELDD